jgi:hypothetical protein
MTKDFVTAYHNSANDFFFKRALTQKKNRPALGGAMATNIFF